MKRSELEHVIRAAGSIAGSARLVIIGSQAILASFPNAPAELTVSQELDLYPLDAPEKADLIAAGREKDLEFVTAMLRHRLVTVESVERVLIELDPSQAQSVGWRLQRAARAWL